MKKKIELNSSKVRKLLALMNDSEFRYAEIQMSMARDAKNLIKEYGLTKRDFCEMCAGFCLDEMHE